MTCPPEALEEASPSPGFIRPILWELLLRTMAVCGGRGDGSCWLRVPQGRLCGSRKSCGEVKWGCPDKAMPLPQNKASGLWESPPPPDPPLSPQLVSLL
ncbi:Guanine Nucleotide Exchange Factor Vav3 [Manis pentadactyla]|nr:Guanine Nucleotide Exchange Factor Vav3 [Manis pentadactyla]